MGAAIGNAVSGFIAGYFYKTNKALLPVTIGFGYLISMPLLSLLFSPTLTEGLSASFSFFLHVCVLFVLGILLNIPGPSLKVILLNVNKPQYRGTATAIGEFFNNLGRIAGPIIFTYLEHEMDRVNATLTASNFFFVSSAFSFMLKLTIEKDEENVSEYIKNLKEVQGNSKTLTIDIPQDQKSIEDVPLLHALYVCYIIGMNTN